MTEGRAVRATPPPRRRARPRSTNHRKIKQGEKVTNPQSAFDQLAAFFAQQQQQQQQQAAPAPAPAPAAQYPVHQPGYPVAPQMPQGFAPQQPAPAPVSASIDDFFNQP